MAYLIKVKDEEEMIDMISSKNKIIATEIVTAILNNLDTDKNHINILEIHLEETDIILDVTANRENFAYTLEKNIPALEHHEEYELCARVKKGIEYLESLG